MRGWMLAVVLMGLAQGASAADMPVLRGGFFEAPAARVVNWEGGYIGGQASYGSADMNFTSSAKSLFAKLLNNVDIESEYKVSEWPLQGRSSQQSSGFGGFVGYNSQWDDVVLGVELNYVHGKFYGESVGTQGRSFFYPTDYFTTANLRASSSMTINDFGSLRARAGYAWGSFLPYMFGGVALGQADIKREASSSLYYKYVGSAIPSLPDIGPSSRSLADNANAHFVYGYAAGLGVDVMLVASLFLRAEWEYLRFTAPVDVSVNTVRAGLGYKF